MDVLVSQETWHCSTRQPQEVRPCLRCWKWSVWSERPQQAKSPLNQTPILAFSLRATELLNFTCFITMLYLCVTHCLSHLAVGFNLKVPQKMDTKCVCISSLLPPKREVWKVHPISIISFCVFFKNRLNVWILRYQWVWKGKRGKLRRQLCSSVLLRSQKDSTYPLVVLNTQWPLLTYWSKSFSVLATLAVSLWPKLWYLNYYIHYHEMLFRHPCWNNSTWWISNKFCTHSQMKNSGNFCNPL